MFGLLDLSDRNNAVTATQAFTFDYRDQIQRCAQAMSLAHHEDVRPFLDRGMHVEQVRLFTDGNIEKRLGKLLDQLELLKEGFDDLEQMVTEFLHEVPLAAYDTGCSDGSRFLKWLRLSQIPTLEQQDRITCQEARNEVETLARNNRLGHVRFQELWRLTPTLRGELETNPKLRILLNPIRVRAIFHTVELLDDDAVTPAEVLFFACSSQIRTSTLEDSANRHLQRLASHGPFTLVDWMRLDRSVPRSELMEFCFDAADMGLLAFG